MLITLMTDFGTVDGYVAELKGAVLSSVPEATLVDVTHSIPAHDILAARTALARYWPRFPQGTVHVVVVDPGVGTSRAALIVEWEKNFFVGPDNGVLTDPLERPGARAWALRIDPAAAPTFHGRDVFAPAAAALAVGTPAWQLGSPFSTPVRLPLPALQQQPDGATIGVIVAIDHFGNCVTNIPLSSPAGRVEHEGRLFPVRRTYGDAADGEVVAVIGSTGFVEIAVRNGRADEQLQLRRGDSIRLVAT